MGRVASVRRVPDVVVGVDPGYAACGIVVIVPEAGRRWRMVRSVTIETPPEAPLDSRIAAVWAALRARLVGLPGSPGARGLLAYEGQKRVQEGKRAQGRLSHTAVALHEVVGTVKAAAWERELEVEKVEPDEYRKALGLPRNANKQQVQRMVRAVLLDCPERMQLHESDAGAVAFCAALRGRPVPKLGRG